MFFCPLSHSLITSFWREEQREREREHGTVSVRPFAKSARRCNARRRQFGKRRRERETTLRQRRRRPRRSEPTALTE